MRYDELQEFITDLSDAERLVKSKQISNVYSSALKDIKAEIAKAHTTILNGVKKENYYNEMIKFDRLKKLEANILETYRPYAKEIGKRVEAASIQSFSNSFYYNQYGINWISPYNYVRVPNDALQLSVYRNREAVIKALTPEAQAIIPKTPKNLTEWIATNKLDEVNKIFDVIDQGLLTGKSYRETAKELTDAFDGFNKNALRTVRTEGHRNMESGSYTNWVEAQNKGVEGYRLMVAVKDTSTRSQSAYVDGKKDRGEGFLYPDGNRYFIPGNTGIGAWDINDRETTIEIIDGIEPTVERGRNPATGKNEVIEFQSFNAWAKSKGLKRDKNGILRQGKVKIKR
jgi:nucleoid DNA-binding protein